MQFSHISNPIPKAISIACGINHTIVLMSNYTVYTCGNNSYGQLGDNTIINKSSPIQTVAGGTGWKQVSVAGNQLPYDVTTYAISDLEY